MLLIISAVHALRRGFFNFSYHLRLTNLKKSNFFIQKHRMYFFSTLTSTPPPPAKITTVAAPKNV